MTLLFGLRKLKANRTKDSIDFESNYSDLFDDQGDYSFSSTSFSILN